MAIVFRPRTTWRRIAAETTSAQALIFGYVLPLAAIGPLATDLALRETTVRIASDRIYHASIATALAEALTSYGFALGGVALVTLIIAALIAATAIGCAMASGFVFGASAAVVWGIANIPPP